MSANVTSTDSFSVLTPSGRGAVAVISIRGNNLAEKLSSLIRHISGKPIRKLPLVGRMAYVYWNSEIGSEDVVLVPRTDESLEINCHGGAVPVSAICDSLRKVGFQQQPAHQEIETLKQDTLFQLTKAVTKKSAESIFVLGNVVLPKEFQSNLALIDTGQIQPAIDRMQSLLDETIGMRMIDPFQVVIVGKPNVGKSSLINAITGFERTIVFDQPGTTRDSVRIATSVLGWPVEFFDTAGIRESNDIVEREGVQRAIELVLNSDLAIFVREISSPLDDQDRFLQSKLANHERIINVWNKSDLEHVNAADNGDLVISTVASNRQDHIELVLDAVGNRLDFERFDPNRPTLFSQWQRETIEEILNSLRLGELENGRQLIQQLLRD